MKEPRAAVLDTHREGALQTEAALERQEAEVAAEERRLAAALGAAEGSGEALAGELRALASAAEALRTRRSDDDSAALLREVRGLAAPDFRVADVRAPWRVARAAAAARRRSACEAVQDTLDDFTRASAALRERLAALHGRLTALEARPAPAPAVVDDEVSALETALAAAVEAQPTVAATAQRRSHPRRQLVARVDGGSDSNFYGGFSTDVSEGGLFVATVTYPPLGATIDLRFTLPSGYTVETAGVVQWVREVNDATPEVMPGAGVRFVDLPAAAAEAIRAFVAQREPLFFVD